MEKRKGIDISVHQGDVSLALAKKFGIDFVIPRCGYATIKDDKYEQNVESAKAVGMDIVGIYLFSYALTVRDAIDEARFAVSQAEKMNLPKITVIFFDLEYDTIRYARQKGVTLDKDRCMRHTEAFCEEVENLGYRAGVYFNLDYHKNMYEPELLNKYVRWLADWTGAPNVDCDIQQFTSSGRVPGITGPVDMNYQLTDLGIDDTTPNESILDVVDKVLQGEYGNGDERKEKLEAEGWGYSAVQQVVNDYVEVAEEVIRGDWGNNPERKISLASAGYDFLVIQKYVNKLIEERDKE